MLAVPPSIELALTDKYPPVPFTTFRDLYNAVSARHDKLYHGFQDQYLSFCNLKPAQFEILDARRTLTIGKGARFTYFPDIETLIIKLTSGATEVAHSNLSMSIYLEVVGVKRRQVAGAENFDMQEFCPIGKTTFTGQNGSVKEGDSTFINIIQRPKNSNWPHLVIQAGLSEALPRLRSDARWWLEHSGGQIDIVILIWIQSTAKIITLEKWTPGTALTRRSHRLAQSNAFPTRSAEITINISESPSVITGAPLVLEFEKLVGRPANSPLEQDVILTDHDLDKWAMLIQGVL
ncbi:uncharacterized protein LDX57_006856 [Aspergillus melleus]|uniref:uncharacterized protein n=1 Tax=Aspergillus melleus TaxID=138277 RepID=UPI001E8D4027|nr:uncharacterized protein LDX57_006856 [Aspergillus melleus]KAH8429187.1 hypothetical protein LDX57_006856 [Aspergillus melleus]